MNPDWELEGETETVGVWSSKHKEEWLLQRLYELAKANNSNTFKFPLADVLTPYEGMDDPARGFQETLFYAREQRKMLEIFEFRNVIKIEQQYDTDYRHLVIRLIERTKPDRSMYVKDGYKTIKDVLHNAELRESLFGIILRTYGVQDAHELQRKRSIKVEIDERFDGYYQDEKILLLEALGIAKADWEGLKNQNHRTFGNRLISVSFDGERVCDFTDALLGKKSLIEKRTLRLIAELLVKAKPDECGEFWSEFFIENGISSTLFPTEYYNLSLTNFIYEVLLILASTGDKYDKELLEKVLSETIHPLFYKGHEETARKYEQELNKLLKYSELKLHGGCLLPITDVQSNQSNKSVIKPSALEQISWIVKDLNSTNGLYNFFRQVGVQESLIPNEPGSKQKLVYGVLSVLSNSEREEDKVLLFHILEEICHPLNFGGDAKRAKVVAMKITMLIRYDNLSLIGGTMHQFNEKDNDLITEFEENQSKVDPALAESLSEFFGGSTFGSAFVPLGAKKKEIDQNAAHQSNLQQEASAMHVHIHNDNTVTQSIQLPNLAAESKKDEDAQQQKKYKPSLPSGTKWEQIIIKFLDDEHVSIHFGDKSSKYHCGDMGFIGKGNKLCVAWAFLLVLAKQHGEISIQDSTAKQKYRKQKEILTKKLQSFFSIEYDPFYPYRSSSEKMGNSYKIKLQLIPPSQATQSYEETEIEDDPLGISEYLEEQTPSIHDNWSGSD